jgi:hypothetical protein
VRGLSSGIRQDTTTRGIRFSYASRVVQPAKRTTGLGHPIDTFAEIRAQACAISQGAEQLRPIHPDRRAMAFGSSPPPVYPLSTLVSKQLFPCEGQSRQLLRPGQFGIVMIRRAKSRHLRLPSHLTTTPNSASTMVARGSAGCAQGSRADRAAPSFRVEAADHTVLFVRAVRILNDRLREAKPCHEIAGST